METANPNQSMLWELAETAFCFVKDGRTLTAPEPRQLYKSHWDFMLQEMAWLAVDFYEERKWKVNSANRISLLIRNRWNEKKRQNKQWAASSWSSAVQSFWLDILKQVHTPDRYFTDASSLVTYECAIADEQFGILQNRDEAFFAKDLGERTASSLVSRELYTYCLTTIVEQLESSGAEIILPSSDVVLQNRHSPAYQRPRHEEQFIDEESLNRLDPLTIEVVPTVPLWSDSLLEPRSFTDAQDYTEAKEAAVELAIHTYQEQGMFFHPVEFRPPDPLLDVVNLPALLSTSYEDNTLFLHLFISSIEGLSSFLRKKRKYDPSFTLDVSVDVVSEAAANDSRKKKNRKKSQKRILPLASDAPTNDCEFVDPYGFDPLELTMLERYVALYAGSGKNSCDGQVCVNWRLVALSLTIAMKASGTSHQLRTAQHCQDRYYSLKRQLAQKTLTLPRPAESVYAPKVYSLAPAVLFSNQTSREPRFMVAQTSTDSVYTNPDSRISFATNEINKAEARTISLPKPRPSMVSATRALFDKVVFKPGIPVKSLLTSRQAKQTTLLDEHETNCLRQLATVVSRFGNNMKKRSLSNQNFFEAFQLRNKLAPDTDLRNPKCSIPVHPSHAKVSQIANQVTSQYFSSANFSRFLERSGEEDGFIYRNHPNCALQVRLAEYTRYRLRQLPISFNAFPRARKPQLPDMYPPEDVFRNQLPARQVIVQDRGPRLAKQISSINTQRPPIQGGRNSSPPSTFVSQRGTLTGALTPPNLGSPQLPRPGVFGVSSRSTSSPATLPPPAAGSNTPVPQPQEMSFTPGPPSTQSSSGGSRGGGKKGSDPNSPPTTKRKRATPAALAVAAVTASSTVAAIADSAIDFSSLSSSNPHNSI